MADPIYLTNAERPLRPLEIQDRYRFALLFRLKGIQYVRWFPSPEDRSNYLKSLVGADMVRMGEEPTFEERERRSRLLDHATRAGQRH